MVQFHFLDHQQSSSVFKRKSAGVLEGKGFFVSREVQISMNIGGRSITETMTGVSSD